MTATYTFDVFSSLDGYGAAGGDWTGYWGKQGPELLDHRLALYDGEQRMVFGAKTYRLFEQMLAESTEESDVRAPWVTRMRSPPTTVVCLTSLRSASKEPAGPSRRFASSTLACAPNSVSATVLRLGDPMRRTSPVSVRAR